MADLMLTQGLYFEDFAVGNAITTQGRTITEADIVGFAGLSGDWNAIHTDAEYAGQGMFGERIAHGLLVLSIASGLAERMGFMKDTILAFMGLDWKFKGAVKIGDTIKVQMTVAECRELRRLGGGVVTFNIDVFNQRAEVVQKGAWNMLVRSRPAQ